MQRIAPTVLLPLIVLAIVFVIITGIGNLLLAVRYATGSVFPPVFVALGLAVAVLAVCTFLATRSYETE